MLKETFTYTDFEGVERTEDFYFNLTQAELTEWEVSRTGGLTKLIEKIVAEKDSAKIVEVVKDLILRAYGEKSPDGRRMMKNDAIREAFSQTQVYSDLFVKLSADAEATAAFVNGIVPKIPSK